MSTGLEVFIERVEDRETEAVYTFLVKVGHGGIVFPDASGRPGRVSVSKATGAVTLLQASPDDNERGGLFSRVAFKLHRRWAAMTLWGNGLHRHRTRRSARRAAAFPAPAFAGDGSRTTALVEVVAAANPWLPVARAGGGTGAEPLYKRGPTGPAPNPDPKPIWRGAAKNKVAPGKPPRGHLCIS